MRVWRYKKSRRKNAQEYGPFLLSKSGRILENLNILYVDEKPYLDLDSLINLLGVYHTQLAEMPLSEQLEKYNDVAGFVKSFAAALTLSLIEEE